MIRRQDAGTRCQVSIQRLIPLLNWATRLGLVTQILYTCTLLNSAWYALPYLDTLLNLDTQILNLGTQMGSRLQKTASFAIIQINLLFWGGRVAIPHRAT